MPKPIGSYAVWIETITNSVAADVVQLITEAERISGHEINLDDILDSVRNRVLTQLNDSA